MARYQRQTKDNSFGEVVAALATGGLSLLLSDGRQTYTTIVRDTMTGETGRGSGLSRRASEAAAWRDLEKRRSS
jgi:hypothetical protein